VHAFHQSSGMDLVDVVRKAHTHAMAINKVVVALANEVNQDPVFLYGAFVWGEIYNYAEEKSMPLHDVVR